MVVAVFAVDLSVALNGAAGTATSITSATEVPWS